MKENLGQKQERFFAKIPALHREAIKIGIKMGYGHQFSCHKLKLAEDINFIRDGMIVRVGPEHRELHDWWDTQGGSERLPHDMNHYSFEYNGRR